jgi:hypothetical protein
MSMGVTYYGANIVKDVCDVLDNDGPRSEGMLSIAPCVKFDVRCSSIAIIS